NEIKMTNTSRQDILPTFQKLNVSRQNVVSRLIINDRPLLQARRIRRRYLLQRQGHTGGHLIWLMKQAEEGQGEHSA
ncbi:MAG TPA: hypothetical protein VGE66_20950, partial [Chitinophagaceae bacterium]